MTLEEYKRKSRLCNLGLFETAEIINPSDYKIIGVTI